VAAAFVAVELTTGGGYEASNAKAMIAVVNEAPSVVVSVPGEDEEVVGPNATVLGSMYDLNGLATATLTVDTGTPIDLLDADGETTVLISEVVAGLAVGEHTVTVAATDSLGQETEVVVTFTLLAEEEDAGTDMLPWIVAAIGWIVAAVVLVVLLMKMRKPAAPEAVEEPEEEKKV
jgi:hypothetical protein